MQEKKITKKQLAEKLGWNKKEVRDFLSGDYADEEHMFDVFQAFWALGYRLTFTIEPICCDEN